MTTDLLLFVFIFTFFWMFLFWILAIKINNYSIVDVAWALGFFPIFIYLFFICDGWIIRKIVIVLIGSFWSIRLSHHIFRRLMKLHPKEEERYISLRQYFSKYLSLKYLIFFELQALLIFILAIPFIFIYQGTKQSFHILEWLGIVVTLISIWGEKTADRQLQIFKSDLKNVGKVCEVGLWYYSRHPNYFFEWLFWCGIFLMACAFPLGWITIHAPLLILFFLLKVTGVPTSESQSLKSKGENYRNYQKSTSIFFPWFKKEIPN